MISRIIEGRVRGYQPESKAEADNPYRDHLPFTIYLFIYLFTDLFIERACPQLAKANLGGPCLNKQITKKICIYNTDKN